MALLLQLCRLTRTSINDVISRAKVLFIFIKLSSQIKKYLQRTILAVWFLARQFFAFNLKCSFCCYCCCFYFKKFQKKIADVMEIMGKNSKTEFIETWWWITAFSLQTLKSCFEVNAHSSNTFDFIKLLFLLITILVELWFFNFFLDFFILIWRSWNEMRDTKNWQYVWTTIFTSAIKWTVR